MRDFNLANRRFGAAQQRNKSIADIFISSKRKRLQPLPVKLRGIHAQRFPVVAASIDFL
jgi:hypothetical protein